MTRTDFVNRLFASMIGSLVGLLWALFLLGMLPSFDKCMLYLATGSGTLLLMALYVLVIDAICSWLAKFRTARNWRLVNALMLLVIVSGPLTIGVGTTVKVLQFRSEARAMEAEMSASYQRQQERLTAYQQSMREMISEADKLAASNSDTINEAYPRLNVGAYDKVLQSIERDREEFRAQQERAQRRGAFLSTRQQLIYDQEPAGKCAVRK
jgi:hypothetical protein